MKNKILNFFLILFYIFVIWFGVVFVKTFYDNYKNGVNKFLDQVDVNKYFSKPEELDEMSYELEDLDIESKVDTPYTIVDENGNSKTNDTREEEEKSLLEKTFDNMFGISDDKGSSKSTKNNKNSGKSNNSGSNNNSDSGNTKTNNNNNTGNNNSGKNTETNNNSGSGTNNTKPSNSTNTGTKDTSNTKASTNTNNGTNNKTNTNTNTTKPSTNTNSGTNNKTNTNTNTTKPSTSTNTAPSTADRIHYISTGNADAIVIESNGHFGLVDSSHPLYQDGTPQAAGSNKNHTVYHVITYLEKLMNCSGTKCKGKLNFVVATHSHSDHIGGMYEIANTFANSNTTYYYKSYVKTSNDYLKNGIYNSGKADGSYDASQDWYNEGYYKRSLNAMKNNGAKLVDVTEKNISFNLGDYNIKLLNTSKVNDDESVCFKLDSNNKFVALYNDVGDTSKSECSKKGGIFVGRDENVNSIIELITYKQSKTLLAGDIESYDEARLINNSSTKSLLSNIDVLKLGHHGYDTSNRKYFLDVLKPKDAIMTGGGMNAQAKNVLELNYANNKLKTRIYTTDNVSDAIVQTYDSKGNYTIKSNNSSENLQKIEFKEFKTNGKFHLIGVYDSLGKFEKSGLNVGLFYYDGVNAFLKKADRGWKKIDGYWYYLYRNGYVLRGWNILSYNGNEEWFHFNEDGKMSTGWIASQKDGDTQKYWYYLGDNGIMRTGWQKINYKGKEEWFCFMSNGKMRTGWQKIKYKGKEEWFYFDSNGVMQTDWQKIVWKGESHWFYFDSNGVMQRNGCQTINNKNFCFDSNGICYKGEGC